MDCTITKVVTLLKYYHSHKAKTRKTRRNFCMDLGKNIKQMRVKKGLTWTIVNKVDKKKVKFTENIFLPD